MLAKELQQEYQRRFVNIAKYRRRVWRVLVKSYFQGKVGQNQDILDLGCGWGEFINEVQAKSKYAMDLNPDAAEYLNPEITFFCIKTVLKLGTLRITPWMWCLPVIS